MRTPAARGAALCQWAVLGTLAPAILLALLPGYAMDLPFRLLCAGVETLLALCMGVHPRDFGLHTHFTPAVGLMRNALKKDGDEQ